MKNYKLLLGLAAGLFFAGCSTDDLGNDSPIVEKDEIRYMHVSICAPGAATRVDFAEGDEVEVGKLKFYFYDIDGKPTGASTDATLPTWKPGTETSVDVEAKSVVPVSLKKGDKLPSYVVCLINSVGYDETKYDHTTLAALRDEKTETIVDVKEVAERGKVPYFKMNNTVYYGADPVKGETNTRIFGTPINASTQLYKDPTEAGKNPAINIYVERYAARVTVQRDATFSNSAYTNVDNYILEFNPISWGVNADVQETYISKRFVLSSDPTAVPDYGKVNENLNNWVWNDETNHRSYWACSPTYYADAFPIVSDDVSDKATTGTTGAGVAVDPYKHIYYSYAGLTNVPTTTSALNKCAAFTLTSAPTTLYCKENTVGAKAYGSKNPKAAVPSVVLCGWYKVKAAIGAPAGVSDLGEKTTFYLFGQKADGKWKLYTDANILSTMLGQQRVLAKDVLGTTFDNANNSALKVMHPSVTTRQAANLTVPTRYVTLQIDTTQPLTGIYVYNETDKAWKQMTTADADKINTRLIQSLGYAQMYKDGACYFSVPIEHLRRTEELNADDTPNANFDKPWNDKDFKWKEARPGDFGLVRNHAYTINIKSISGLATGLSDKNTPIVPPMDEDNYYVGYTINILKWAVVPTQNVEL